MRSTHRPWSNMIKFHRVQHGSPFDTHHFIEINFFIQPLDRCFSFLFQKLSFLVNIKAIATNDTHYMEIVYDNWAILTEFWIHRMARHIYTTSQLNECDFFPIFLTTINSRVSQHCVTLSWCWWLLCQFPYEKSDRSLTNTLALAWNQTSDATSALLT